MYIFSRLPMYKMMNFSLPLSHSWCTPGLQKDDNCTKAIYSGDSPFDDTTGCVMTPGVLGGRFVATTHTPDQCECTQ